MDGATAATSSSIRKTDDAYTSARTSGQDDGQGASPGKEEAPSLYFS